MAGRGGGRDGGGGRGGGGCSGRSRWRQRQRQKEVKWGAKAETVSETETGAGSTKALEEVEIARDGAFTALAGIASTPHLAAFATPASAASASAASAAAASATTAFINTFHRSSPAPLHAPQPSILLRLAMADLADPEVQGGIRSRCSHGQSWLQPATAPITGCSRFQSLFLGNDRRIVAAPDQAKAESGKRARQEVAGSLVWRANLGALTKLSD